MQFWFSKTFYLMTRQAFSYVNSSSILDLKFLKWRFKAHIADTEQDSHSNFLPAQIQNVYIFTLKITIHPKLNKVKSHWFQKAVILPTVWLKRPKNT